MVINGNDMYPNHISNDNFVYGPKRGNAGSPFWTRFNKNYMLIDSNKINIINDSKKSSLIIKHSILQKLFNNSPIDKVILFVLLILKEEIIIILILI